MLLRQLISVARGNHHRHDSPAGLTVESNRWFYDHVLTGVFHLPVWSLICVWPGRSFLAVTFVPFCGQFTAFQGQTLNCHIGCSGRT